MGRRIDAPIGASGSERGIARDRGYVAGMPGIKTNGAVVNVRVARVRQESRAYNGVLLGEWKRGWIDTCTCVTRGDPPRDKTGCESS